MKKRREELENEIREYKDLIKETEERKLDEMSFEEKEFLNNSIKEYNEIIKLDKDDIKEEELREQQIRLEKEDNIERERRISGGRKYKIVIKNNLVINEYEKE